MPKNSGKSGIVVIWLPVILLPVANLLGALLSIASFDCQMMFRLVAAAVCEELFFRWFLLKQCLFRYEELSPVIAIAIVSVIFAGMHLFNLRNGAPVSETLVQVACAFCFGIWAGAVVWKTGKVTIPVIAHVLLNATAMAENMWISLLVSFFVLLDGVVLIGDKY